MLALQALTLDAGKDNVVTVFGFPNNVKSQAQILQEFGKCGDVLRFHRDTQCNWMHLQYAVRSGLCLHDKQCSAAVAAVIIQHTVPAKTVPAKTNNISAVDKVRGTACIVEEWLDIISLGHGRCAASSTTAHASL